jgi:hypothetical protein
LRKYLIAAIAALATMAFAAVAVAQSSEVTSTASVSPKKAGTKKKPKNTSLTTVVTSTASDRITTKIEIQLPKTLAISAKGFATCSVKTILKANGKDCKKGSKVGKGTADALAGIGTSNPVPVTFDVTAFVSGAKKINFLLVARGLGNVYISPGTLSKTSKGPKLTVKVPAGAQQPVTGLWATLTRLNTTLGKKSGKHKLIASTGCKSKQQTIGTKLTFASPPPPGGTTPTPAGSGSTSTTAACTK